MAMKTALFTRTEKQPEQMRGQAALVFASLENHPEGATLGTVIDEIVANGLVTRQEPMRIALYYLAIFKKRGLITAVEVDVDAEPNAQAETPAVESVAQDEFVPVTEDEAVEAAEAVAELVEAE